MNKTKIDWADMTWNPVTGCLNDCDYCYARRLATRFGSKQTESLEIMYAINGGVRPDRFKGAYPFGFKPTYHPGRLNSPKSEKKPQNIFVCSMADLFGSWVPQEWIDTVIMACHDAPWHNYIFLTKNPARYEEYVGYSNDRWFTENMWIGTTITNNHDMNLNGYLLARAGNHMKNENTFLSIEPLHDKLDTKNLQVFNWIIIGAETGNRKGRVKPKKDWIDSIVEECKKHDIPIFMKDSLEGIWSGELIQELPRGLMKGETE